MLRACVNGRSSSNWPTRTAERIRRQFQKPADVDELQVAVAQSAGAVVAGDADVVIHPERDIAAEIARREDAEQAGFKIGSRNELRHRCPARRAR